MISVDRILLIRYNQTAIFSAFRFFTPKVLKVAFKKVKLNTHLVIHCHFWSNIYLVDRIVRTFS